jgi:hypothetical protein
MRDPNFLKRTAGRFCGVLVFSLLLAVSASAYTVVMRGGRRVEVPAQFVVTATTLTYEVSPGVQVTLALAAIDIPATEKANNELTGSLMRRLQSGSALTAEKSLQSRRTITNKDLEASMHRRQDSELAYENRRKELGLPSVEESRRRAAMEADSIRLELKQKRAVEQQSEIYWRERATALRTEMAAVDGELAYVRSRLDEGPAPLSDAGWFGGSSATFSTITGLPFGNFGRGQFGHGGWGRHSARVNRPGIFVAPRGGSQISGRIGFGAGATRGQVLVNPGHVRPGRAFGATGGFSVFPNAVVLGSSDLGYDLSYERSALITRFNELGAARAGLTARWRELEEDARHAGVSPGWLRP